MANKDEELGIDVTADFKKFEAQLGAVYKRIQSKGVVIKVGVNIDPKAAQELAAFQKQINQAFAGGNMGTTQAAKDLQNFFSGVSRGVNSLSKNAKDLPKLGAAFSNLASSMSNVRLGSNAKQVTDFFGGMAKSGTALLRVTKNVDSMITAINRLIGRLQILQKTGQLDILKNLPGNMGFTEKGGIRMQPIKIVAPNEAEWNAIKGQMESRLAAKPIKAKIEPVMSNQGLQKFQNLLIALSFGQFSQNLERMSRQIISSYSSIEQAQTTLRTVYRDDPKRAEQVFKFLTKKESETPFNFEEMLQGGTQFAVQEKQLKKYGFNVERSVNMASELAAAFGQGKPGAIMDIQTGISRLMTGDQNGFEILDKFGISRSALRQNGLSVGKNGVALKSDSDIQAVLEAIERFTMKTTGGGLAERQNQTVAGQISNMQSQAMKTQASLLEPLEGTFRKGVTILTAFLDIIEEAPAPIRGFIGAMVLGTTALMKAAQQVASVGLLVLGANNAGLLDGLKGGAARKAAQAAGESGAGAAGSAAAGAAGGLASRLFPTFIKWAGALRVMVVGFFETVVAGIGAFFTGPTVAGAIIGEVTATLGAIATGVGAIFIPLVALGAGLVAIAGTVATVVGFLVSPKKMWEKLTGALSSAGSAGGSISSGGVSGNMVSDYAGKLQSEADFKEKWHGSSQRTQALQRAYYRGSELSRITNGDARDQKVTKNDFTDAIAVTMQKRRDLEAAGKGETDTEMIQVNQQLEALMDKRRNYNDLVRQTNDLTEIELKTAQAINEAKLALGQIDARGYAESLKAEGEVRKSNLAEAIKSGQAGDIATKTQEWFEWLVKANAAQKAIKEEMRGQVKAANDLLMATGGTATDALAAAAQDANLMPSGTPGEVNARNSALAGVEGQRFQMRLARQRRGIDIQEGSGDTLGAQINRIKADSEDTWRASGGQGDRVQIDRLANQKILAARFEFYQQLSKMAADNLNALQSIENQRIQIAKTSNESSISLLGGKMGRKDIESQLGSNPEMKKLALKQQDLILTETRTKLSQAKAKYLSDISQAEANLDNMKSKQGTDPRLIANAERSIQLRKEAYRGERGEIKASGAASLSSARQSEQFRNEDLSREAAQSKLESQAESLRIQKDKIDADMGKSKEKYVDLLKQQLKLELDSLKAKFEAAKLDTKLTKAQRDNLKSQYDNDVATTQTKYSGSASDSKVAGYQAKINTYKSAAEADPNMKPQAKLMNLKKQLDLEKAILFEKLKQDMAKPGADATALQKKKNYLSDLNNLQLQYLDSAKKVTGEIEAQNAALIARYNNADSKSGMFAGGFSMGEVFGIEDLGANLQMDSEYSQMKYKQLGTKGGFDPFSKDKWDVKDYANSAKTDAFGNDALGKVPSNMKELEKINLAAEYTLKVVAPDGVTTTFKNAYNGPVNNGGKGTI